jgi:hypothetical protein
VVRLNSELVTGICAGMYAESFDDEGLAALKICAGV